MRKIALFTLSLLSAGLAQAADEVVLGTSLSITGKYASAGKATRDGYALGVKRVNDKGGVKIGAKTYQLKFVFEDDGSVPEKSAEIVEKLITKNGLRLLLGPYSSGITAAAAEVSEKNKALMIDCCGADRSLFQKGRKYFFGVLTGADKYLTPAVDLLAEESKKSGKDPQTLKVAVAVEPDPFSRDVRAGVLEAVERYGMKVVVKEELPKDLSDMAPILEKVKAAKPDLLIVSGHDKGAITATKQISEMKVHVPMIALTHCDSTQLAEKFGKAAENFVCSSQWDDSLPFTDRWFGSAKEYARAFNEAYQYKASYISAQASASVLVYAQALEKAGSVNVEKVREALSATNMKTFYGVIRFDEHGSNPARTMVTYQIQKGDLKIVFPSQWAESKLVYPAPPR